MLDREKIISDCIAKRNALTDNYNALHEVKYWLNFSTLGVGGTGAFAVSISNLKHFTPVTSSTNQPEPNPTPTPYTFQDGARDYNTFITAFVVLAGVVITNFQIDETMSSSRSSIESINLKLNSVSTLMQAQINAYTTGNQKQIESLLKLIDSINSNTPAATLKDSVDNEWKNYNILLLTKIDKLIEALQLLERTKSDDNSSVSFFQNTNALMMKLKSEINGTNRPLVLDLTQNLESILLNKNSLRDDVIGFFNKNITDTDVLVFKKNLLDFMNEVKNGTNTNRNKAKLNEELKSLLTGYFIPKAFVEARLLTGIEKSVYLSDSAKNQIFEEIQNFKLNANRSNTDNDLRNAWKELKIECDKASLPPPEIPSGVEASEVTNTGFIVNWPMVNGATNYNVYIDSKLVGRSGQSRMERSIKFSNLNPNTTYKIEISSVNSAGESNKSSPKLIKTLP